MREDDFMIKQRALDFLYWFCCESNYKMIIEKMIEECEKSEVSFRENIAIKISILAEKFAEELGWYVDVILKLVEISGDLLSNEILFRLSQMVIGFENSNDSKEFQNQALKKIFLAINKSFIPESLLKISAFLLSEFAENFEKEAILLFEILEKHFYKISTNAKIVFITAFAKIGWKFESLEPKVLSILQNNTESFNPEIQQRSIEYLQIFLSKDKTKNFFEKMPKFSNKIKNSNILLKKIEKNKKIDRNSFENIKDVANLIRNCMNSGILFENNYLKINFESQFNEFYGKILLKIEKLQEISEINLEIVKSVGLLIEIKKCSELEFLIEVICEEAFTEFSCISLSYKENTNKISNLSLVLPIYLFSFGGRVEMPLDIMEEFYEQYSNTENFNYFQCDGLYLDKNYSNILEFLNFYTRNRENYIFGASQIYIKDKEIIKYPVLIRVAFEENKLKVGLRCAGNSHIIHFFKEFFGFLNEN